jgi:uncharacterized protein with GYD domain
VKAMLFVTLMTPKGKGNEAVKYLRDVKAPEGIKIRDVYFTFGRYDGILIFEAPDESAAMKFVMDMGFATQYTMETLVAVPARELSRS